MTRNDLPFPQQRQVLAYCPPAVQREGQNTQQQRPLLIICFVLPLNPHALEHLKLLKERKVAWFLHSELDEIEWIPLVSALSVRQRTGRQVLPPSSAQEL